MAIPKRNTRGLQDIRTLSGKVDQVSHPYRAYMRISCLEMEKARRGEERASAMHRVNNIDARFREIEAEKAELLKTLDERSSDNRPAHARVDNPRAAHRRSTGGFKVRY